MFQHFDKLEFGNCCQLWICDCSCSIHFDVGTNIFWQPRISLPFHFLQMPNRIVRTFLAKNHHFRLEIFKRCFISWTTREGKLPSFFKMRSTWLAIEKNSCNTLFHWIFHKDVRPNLIWFDRVPSENISLSCSSPKLG